MRHGLMRLTAPALIVGALAYSVSAEAGTLRIGTPSVQGDTITFPVVLEGDVGGGVSAANFRLQFDPNVLEPISVSPGQAASAADKQVQSNLTDAGYNVVMMGLNRNAVPSGEIAQIVMRRVPGADVDATNISITETTLSDPDAVAIPSRGSSETLRFDEPAPEEPDETPDPEPDPSQTPSPDEPSPTQPNDVLPPVLGTQPLSPGASVSEDAAADGGTTGSAGRRVTPGGTRATNPPSPSRDRTGRQLEAARETMQGLRSNLPEGADATGGAEDEASDLAGSVNGPARVEGTPMMGVEPPDTSVAGEETAVAALKRPDNPGAVATTPPAVTGAAAAAATGDEGAPTRSLNLTLWVVLLGVAALLVALFALRRKLFS